MGRRRRNDRLRVRLGKQQAFEHESVFFVPCPLCLAAFPLCRINNRLSDGEVAMTIEDAPPIQSGQGKHRRCLTCRTCNNQRAFEARAGVARIERQTVIEKIRADGPPLANTPLFEQALEIRRITDDEFLLELKAGYLIAYATLGNTYIFDSALDGVRKALATNSIDGLRTVGSENSIVCAHLTGPKPTIGTILEFAGDISGLAVGMRPTHSSQAPDTHAVLLPHSRSPTDLYQRVEAFKTGKVSVVQEYPIPPELKLHQNQSYEGSGESYFLDIPPEFDLSALRAEDEAWRKKTGGD